ncbi:MAG: GNAT family N-acetyltransferase [bacterium]|nr:GNAT family N-acetyltransferase [bacterium]
MRGVMANNKEKMKSITDYKNNDELRRKFNNFTQEIFGFDFEAWYQKGFWDDRYICHSFLEDGQIISNVSTTRFELLIHGKKFNTLQIGTVMTKNEFRGKGLGVTLIKNVIDQYESECDFFYLFGHKNVWEYYKKQHFIPIHEFYYSSEVKNGCRKTTHLRRLDLSNNTDLETIIRLTEKRVPVSSTFGVLNDTSIFLFYCLYEFSQNLLYADTKDCLLVFTVENQDLHLYDVLCESELSFTEITDLLNSEDIEIKRIVFHYTPSYSDINIEPTGIKSGDKMFFKGNRSILPLKFTYPKIAHT